MQRISVARRTPRLLVCSVLALIWPAFGQDKAPTIDAAPAVPIGRQNDDCRTPDPISGGGLFDFDNTVNTTGREGQHFFCDIDAVSGIDYDEWFCWTADCDGTVTISTCGLTGVDTKIALWGGCECPADDQQPLCCNDNDPDCSKQSTIRCDVRCGERYMIQIGTRPGAHPGRGQFSIRCEGRPCNEMYCPPPPCCGAKPFFDDPAYASFTGQVLVMSAEVLFPQTLSDFAITVFDIKDNGTAPLNTNWNPANFRYHDSRWTRINLGSVFGVTLDDVGNIYTAHSTVYNSLDAIGALPGSTAGTIYKLATITGDPTIFINLPNNGPGIGNIAWDCENDQIFATNMEDGRIYRIRGDGTALSAFNPFDGALANFVGGIITNEAGEPDGQFETFGERPWAVKRAGDRLYYSMWIRDSRNIFDPPGGTPNQIWSVQLDASGNFIPATRTLEINMPALPGRNYSQPVSDISFSTDNPARLLSCERSMNNDTNSGAHDARTMEFQCHGGWSLSPANTNINGPNFGFPVGQFAQDANAAGGCDYDPEPNGRVWCTGDALHFGPDYIYGGCGMLRAGAASANNVLFDYNGDVSNGGSDKMEIGDLAIPCQPGSCMLVSDIIAHCEGNFYSTTFTVTNLSGVTAHYILLPNPQTTPHVIPLSPPLPNGASTTVTVTLTGVTPNTEFCFDIILADIYIEACCHGQVCVDIPRCECILPTVNIVCDPHTGLPLLTIHFVNLRPEVLEHAFLTPLPPNGGVTLNPDYFNLPSVPPGGASTITTTISGATPGTVVCIRMSVHEEHLMECCSVVICVLIPQPCSANPCAADVNGDGVLNSLDLFDFITAFFAGEAIADFNHNGTIESDDLFVYLTAFFATCD